MSYETTTVTLTLYTETKAALLREQARLLSDTGQKPTLGSIVEFAISDYLRRFGRSLPPFVAGEGK